MSDTSIRGRFVWHELMTTDTKDAARFFGKVIGWKAKPWVEQPSYSTWTMGRGAPMGGLMPLPEEAKAGGTPPSWVTYIATPDVDETALQAAQYGGRVLRQPAEIPTVGRFALIADPQGAMFAAFTPNQPAQPEKPGPVEVGDFSWHELMTTDWESAFRFYQRVFGWEATGSFSDPAIGTYQMYGRNGRTLGGMFNVPAGNGAPPAWLPYVRVPDARKTAAAIAKAGGTVINGPMEVPGGDWITQAVDPQGVMFAVHSLKPAPARKKAVAKKKAAARKTAAPKKRAAPRKGSRPARRTSARKKTAAKKTARRAARRRGR
jgi:predicted enzyme related to lactoylglutathione lyase